MRLGSATYIGRFLALMKPWLVAEPDSGLDNRFSLVVSERFGCDWVQQPTLQEQGPLLALTMKPCLVAEPDSGLANGPWIKNN